MRILITGGTGLIGRALCKALLAAGHDLTVLSRSPASVAAKCGAQVNAMSSLEEWQTETVFDAVINLAGEPIIDKAWSEQRKQAIWASRVTLTETLVQHIHQAHQKPKVLLSGSAIGYYGDCGVQSLDESAANAHDFGAQLCAAWERAAQAAVEDDVRVCLLRTGLVLSSDGGLFTRMRLPFKLGLGGRLGNGQQYMSWIHIADYVAIVQWLLNDSNASGAFNLTAPNPVSNRQFTETLAKTLQRPAWLHTPAWLLSAILGQRAYLLTGGQRVLPCRVQELGYRFRYEQLQPALHQLVNGNAP